MYRVSPYHIGKIVSELPRTLFLTLEFAIPLYFMIGLYPSFSAFMIFWLIGIIVVMVTESMALCVTTMLPNPQAASALLPVVWPYILESSRIHPSPSSVWCWVVPLGFWPHIPTQIFVHQPPFLCIVIRFLKWLN